MSKRQSARAILLNPQNQMLWLLVADEIGRGGITPFWSVPGGGLEEGETFEATLKREMLEELGLEISEPGIHVATFEGLTQWRDQWYDNDSRFFVLRLEQQEFDFSRHTDLEQEVVKGYRWWSYEEIKNSSDLFLPAAIVEVFGGFVSGNWNGAVRRIGP